MTDPRFGWQYQLILGIPARLNNFIIPQTLVSPTKVSQGTNGVSPDGIVLSDGDYLDYNTIPPKFWEITDLQIKAKINQTKELRTSSDLEITNLDQNIIDQIGQDTLVILRAGYRRPQGNFIQTSVGVGQEQFPDLFVGQVKQISSELKDVDVITKISMGEALTVQRNSRVSKSFPPSSTRKDVIAQLVQLLRRTGIPTGRITPPKENTKESIIYNSKYLSGYSCQGYLMTELEKVCKSCGLRVFTAIGKLYIEPEKTTLNTVIPLALSATQDVPSRNLIYRITPDNIKGQITKIDGDSEPTPSNKNNKAKKKQLSLVTYLDGNMSVGKVARLSDNGEEFDGDYEITSIEFTLDFRGNRWDNTITLMEL